MTRKALSLLLAVLLLAGLLAGCNGGTGGGSTAGTTAAPQNTSKGATTPAATTAPAATTTTAAPSNFNETSYPIVNEPITITAMGTYRPPLEGEPKNQSYWQYLEDMTNIHIEWTLVDNNVENALQLFYAAGEFPDFIFNGLNSNYISDYGVEAGVFADLTELITQYMPNLTTVFERFPTSEKLLKQIDGKIYSLPRIILSTTSATGQMFYRTDYLEELNLPVPATVDEFYDTLVAIKNSGITQGYAPLMPLGNTHFAGHIELFLFPAFGESVNPDFSDNGDGKVVYNRTSEQYRLFLEYAAKLYKDGLLENEAFTIDGAVSTARIKAGQAAFMTQAHMLLEEDFKDGQIHIDHLPPLVSAYTQTQKTREYSYFSTVGGAVNAKSKYIKEILRMCDANYSEEEIAPGFSGMSQNLGIRDKDWEYTDDTKSGYMLTPPASWKESSWDYVSGFVSWNGFINLFNGMNLYSQNPNNLAREKGMVNNNIAYAVTPFPDLYLKYNDEENTKMTNKLTDIMSYVTQMRAKFVTGVEPLSNWDSYVAEIEKMGIAEVLQIKQTAYDRWNS